MPKTIFSKHGTSSLNLKMTTDLRRRIRMAAAERDMGSSQLVREILEREIPKFPKRRKP